MRLQNLATYIGETIKLRPKSLYVIAGILLFLLLDGRAWAETVTVSWAHPQTFVNGATLNPADITGTEVECKSFTPTGGAAQPCTAGIKTLNGSGTSMQIDVGPVDPRGGTFVFVARTKVQWAVSEDSAPAQKVFAAVPPNPPEGLSVIETTAYEVKFKGFRFVLGKPVGTVEIGTQCHKTFELPGGYYQVNREDVTFDRPNKVAVIVAKCG